MILKSLCQFNARTYPDPRIDPFACKLILPGQVCDPVEILTPDERRILNEKITRLQQITSNIKNSSPVCADTTRNTNLNIVISLMEKLGTFQQDSINRDSLNIEKFANQLRSKYQNYQDSLLCDTLVLIVNSRSDRQVFTVAGRDAKLSQEVLQTAFHRSVGHFRLGNYAQGLEGMVEYIVSAYGSAHIVLTPAIGDGIVPTNTQTSSSLSSSGSGHFNILQGVRQKSNINKLERIDLEEVPEEDRLWVRILLKALIQCGDDVNAITFHVKAIAEEAMDISLKLISNLRYNKIEEELQNTDKGLRVREKAWLNLKPYLENLYSKYKHQIPVNVDQCPERKATEIFMNFKRLKN